MSVLDKTLLTTVGAAKYAYNDAHTLPTNFYQIALGDNNGADFIPAVTDGNCVHEVYRANINSLTVDPVDPTIIILQLVLPTGVGGFTVREARVYDTDGVVMYTANPYFIKSLGSSDQNLLFRIKRSSTSAVTLLVDPSITLASQTYVNNAIAPFATKVGVQNCTHTYAETTSGTSTIHYTASYTPAITGFIDGMELSFDIGIYTNTTTTPDFSPNSLTAYGITLQNGVALAIGDMPKFANVKFDSTALKWILLNPLISNSYVTKSGLQNNIHNHVTAGGTSDAITATYTPAYSAWVDGMTFFVKLTATNTTTTPTVSPNGLTAKTIVKDSGTAIRVGDLKSGMIAEFKYSSALDKVICQNPVLFGQLIGKQVFSTAGTFTYTETAGTNWWIAEVVGGGASGGGTPVTAAGQNSAGGGGGAGAWRRSKLIASTHAGVTVTVGAKGVGVSGANGQNGGTSSFGAYVSCTGGTLGQLGVVATGAAVTSSHGTGGTSSGNVGDDFINGGNPTTGKMFSLNNILTGAGGDSPYGRGGYESNGAAAGVAATGYGAGGSGSGAYALAAALAGGNGSDGLVIVWEYS